VLLDKDECRRLAMAASHSEMLWKMRSRYGSFPTGSKVIRLRDGMELSRIGRVDYLPEVERETIPGSNCESKADEL